MLAIFGGVIAGLTGLFIWQRRTAEESASVRTASKRTVQQLAQRFGPAEAQHVERLCGQAEGCECVVSAAKAVLDRDLHAEALTLLRATDRKCGEHSGTERTPLAALQYGCSLSEFQSGKRGNGPSLFCKTR